ncbi:MAG: DivIVA domain-containing protein [Bacilli bacterium]|nr:DivIVA domain-containing protein [Bacilli bacterium]
MEKTIHFEPKDIVEKKFKPDVKGYSAIEVDRYLDLVIEDYQTFNEEITKLRNEIASMKNSSGGVYKENELLIKSNAALIEQKKQLEIENASMKNQLSGIKPGDSINAENMDYIKKIRQYESFLHSEGYSLNDLKSKKQ